jgi:predicted DCC family thiol-disulfide oxidoreductase YuxK
MTSPPLQPRPNNRQVVLFDGFCYLCSWVVRVILSQDRKDRFVCLPLQSEEGVFLTRRFPGISGVDSVVLLEAEQPFVKSRAVLRILGGLGGLWRLFVVFDQFPTIWLDRIYDWVAEVRYRVFGKRASCIIPPRRLRHKLTMRSN